MVVRFELERDGQPVADRHDARVLAGPRHDALAAGRQRAQQRPGALVRAVLAPHDAEHRELEVVRVAAEPLTDRVQLLVGEPERPMQRRRPASRSAGRHPERRRPSVIGRPPGAGIGSAPAALGARGGLDERAQDRQAVVRAEHRSAARSGCGISPATLPRAFETPAMARRRAVRVRRVALGARPRAVGADVPEQDLPVALEARRASPRRRSSSPRRARSAAAAAAGSPTSPVNGVSSRSATTRTSRPRKRSARLRSSAPGTSPASASTWKPLQIPSTSPPSRGEGRDGAHDRAEPRDHARAQVVAVREAAGQHDRGGAVERALLVPQRHRLGARELEAAQRVAVAVRARGRRRRRSGSSRRPRLADVAGAVQRSIVERLDQRVREQLARQPLDDRRAPPRSSRHSTVSSTRRPTRTSDTPAMPRWPRLPSTARPCGSRMPAFGSDVDGEPEPVIAHRRRSRRRRR